MLHVRQASEVYRNTRENFIPEQQHIAEMFLTISTYHFGRSHDFQDILENDWETTLTVGKLKKQEFNEDILSLTLVLASTSACLASKNLTILICPK